MHSVLSYSLLRMGCNLTQCQCHVSELDLILQSWMIKEIFRHTGLDLGPLLQSGQLVSFEQADYVSKKSSKSLPLK